MSAGEVVILLLAGVGIFTLLDFAVAWLKHTGRME